MDQRYTLWMSICQIVKFDHIDFSCDESKENNLIKTLLSYKTLMEYYQSQLFAENTIN